MCGTINEKATINELLDLEVDGIMSDRLRLLRDVLTHRGHRRIPHGADTHRRIDTARGIHLSESAGTAARPGPLPTYPDPVRVGPSPAVEAPSSAGASSDVTPPDTGRGTATLLPV